MDAPLREIAVSMASAAPCGKRRPAMGKGGVLAGGEPAGQRWRKARSRSEA